MTVKEYAGAATVTLTGVLAFIALWFMTDIEAIRLLFLSGVIAMAVGIALVFLLTKDEMDMVDEEIESSRFVDCDGLNVLIQRSRRSA